MKAAWNGPAEPKDNNTIDFNTLKSVIAYFNISKSACEYCKAQEGWEHSFCDTRKCHEMFKAQSSVIVEIYEEMSKYFMRSEKEKQWLAKQCCDLEQANHQSTDGDVKDWADWIIAAHQAVAAKEDSR